jgi:hypothetical protein
MLPFRNPRPSLRLAHEAAPLFAAPRRSALPASRIAFGNADSRIGRIRINRIIRMVKRAQCGSTRRDHSWTWTAAAFNSASAIGSLSAMRALGDSFQGWPLRMLIVPMRWQPPGLSPSARRSSRLWKLRVADAHVTVRIGGLHDGGLQTAAGSMQRSSRSSVHVPHRDDGVVRMCTHGLGGQSMDSGYGRTCCSHRR